MADFGPAVNFVLANEGGLTGDDKIGGLTNFGISQRQYPELDIRAMTIEQAKRIYETDYWNIHHLASLPNQAVANKVFDMVVNMGPYNAIRILQQALGYFKVGPLVSDGKIGPFTATATARVPEDRLMHELRARYAQFHASLACDPKYAPNLLGWLRRDVQ